ncbi:MAG: LysR substrate-binding domain-containing protein [Burkholderiaceae bacterium]|nr:LysR substrate-binding domain-containing protein [Burkholderiaceae bacterium]
MKLNEMRSVRAVAGKSFSISRTAEALHISQPGISRHVIEVEEALGVTLFLRRKNRLVGLTPAGKVLMPLIERILNGVDDLQRIASQFARGESGGLTVATSHTHARYLLPAIIQQFIREFPNADLRIRQGYVNQIAEWIDAGQADVAVSAAPIRSFPELEFHRFSEMHRIVLTPKGHPLLSLARPTLRDLANWPIVTYEREYIAYADIMGAFRKAQLEPRIALSTGDTDIMKSYVQCGLGIAIVADRAFDSRLDKHLAKVDVRRLFPSTPEYVGVKRGRPLSVQALRFIELVAPALGFSRRSAGSC